MKNDIYILDEEAEREIKLCKEEEDEVRKLEEAYKSALSKLKENNKKRRNLINEARLKKIEEINRELEECVLLLKSLSDEKCKLYKKYSEKKEARNRAEHLHARNKIFWPSPDEVYDKVTMSEDEKTLNDLDVEIEKTSEYINYLKATKEYLCKLFGHDANIISSNEYFKCKCCENTIGYRKYIDSYYSAKYRGIVPFYYKDLYEKDYVISSNAEIKLDIPTHDGYPKQLKKK